MNDTRQAKILLQQGDALIVIDLQNDFLPGGTLAIAEGNEVIVVMNHYIAKFKQGNLPVFFTRDWHPPNHQSFVTQGGPWPEHCIAGSKGAEFSTALCVPDNAHIISTGMQVNQQGYSGFENPFFKTQLNRIQVRRLFIGGLATDYCVLYTVREALKLQYRVFLLKDATRPVNRQAADGNNAEIEMQAKGALIITLGNIL